VNHVTNATDVLDPVKNPHSHPKATVAGVFTAETGLATIRTPLTLADITPGMGLETALKMPPQGVIDTMKASGMKGRGGAGFPAGLKWELAAKAEAKDGRRFIICNADEGEPGTFKDRVLLSELPDLIFEGMTIAGYAVGAHEGIVYLRGEYVYLLEHLEERLADRRAAGLLGNDVAGSGFTFDIHIFLGAGAYVCGEETALIESIEGRRGEPRNRPPFPVESGLFGEPTIVNNVETFGWASAIFARGPQWFSAIGTGQSTGPKMLSISGDVRKPGVYEFPLGVSIREVIDAAGGENPKAVIVGGASGTCVPASDFDRAISYEDVSTGGAIIVLGPWRDLLEVAENLQWFFANESCGQCAPCRVGTRKLLNGIRDLRNGNSSTSKLKDLVKLGESMEFASKCGLGQTAPSVFLSLVRSFESEVLGHIPQWARQADAASEIAASIDDADRDFAMATSKAASADMFIPSDTRSARDKKR
jgi:[NiFe] hydrogenase diaphorase moiety large subunit